jgi:hypothetical protein
MEVPTIQGLGHAIFMKFWGDFLNLCEDIRATFGDRGADSSILNRGDVQQKVLERFSCRH